ncbi:hypothetical protein ACFZDJ_25345 [Streptomyces sp. NPDC007896]|uniref:hypothetical protein n=1 Tax=Streptomyces sp. NPDC007896 TaxID=3364784 RepID=UPI0036F1812C
MATACGGAEEERNLRWGLTYLKLEDAGLQKLAPKRGEPLDRAALQEAAVDAEVLLRAIEVRKSELHQLALLKAEPLLAQLDEDLQATTEKNGGNAAECWVDLTDYPRRLVLLFSPAAIETDSRGHADLTVVLDRLAGFSTQTGVKERTALSVQILSAYELAQHTGWYSMDSGPNVYASYGDEFAHYRVQAGRKASQPAPTLLLRPNSPPRQPYVSTGTTQRAATSAQAPSWACSSESRSPWPSGSSTSPRTHGRSGATPRSSCCSLSSPAALSR